MLGSWGNGDKSMVTSGYISDGWISARTHHLRVSNTVLDFQQQHLHLSSTCILQKIAFIFINEETACLSSHITQRCTDPAPTPLSWTSGQAQLMSVPAESHLQLPGTRNHKQMQSKGQKNVNQNRNNLETRAIAVRKREVWHEANFWDHGKNPAWPGTRDLSRSCAPVWGQRRLAGPSPGWLGASHFTNVCPGPNQPGNITKLWKDKLSRCYTALTANVHLWEENTFPDMDAPILEWENSWQKA